MFRLLAMTFRLLVFSIFSALSLISTWGAQADEITDLQVRIEQKIKEFNTRDIPPLAENFLKLNEDKWGKDEPKPLP